MEDQPQQLFLTDVLNDAAPERRIAFRGKTYSESLDHARLKTRLQKVFGMLYDGEWHTSVELMKVGGIGWSSRVRQLREKQFSEIEIWSARTEVPGVWKYKMNRATVTAEAVALIMSKEEASNE